MTTKNSIINLPKLRSTVSFVIVTRGDRLDILIELLKQLIPLKDELVVILDNSDAAVKDSISPYCDKVVQDPGRGMQEAYTCDFFKYCTKDWIFWIDDDETLNRNCTKEILQHYISDRSVASYWVPTRWYINSDEYICSHPWHPDYHPRLFRNLPCIVKVPSGIHQYMRISGLTAWIDEICINHWCLVINSRQEREAKVKHYEKQAPGNGNDAYYLYEEERYETATDSDCIQLKHYCRDDCSYEITKVMGQSLNFALTVKFNIRNDEAKSVISTHDGVYASYHWLNEDMTEYRWDNERSSIVRGDDGYESLLYVSTPDKSGYFYFQVDIVEEGVRWFGYCGLLTSEIIKVRVL